MLRLHEKITYWWPDSVQFNGVHVKNIQHFIDIILVIDLIFIIGVIFTLSSIIYLNWKLTGPVRPQPVVPLVVFFTGNLVGGLLHKSYFR